MSFVKVERLTVMYGKFTAVNMLSFAIPKGEVFGFIGPNGAGKTTTIRVMATLLKPTYGRVTVNGMDVSRSQEVRRMIGYMPDSFGAYDDLTVNEYLHFFAAAYQIEWGKREKTILDVLELTELAGKRTSQVNALSRGMKQRLGLARLLLHDPEFLLLDEPASGLDPRARIEMRELLKELRRMGKTILISSHILPELAELCTRIGIIEQGKLVAEGSVKEIYDKINLRRNVRAQIVNITDELLGQIRKIHGVKSAEAENDVVSIDYNDSILTPEDLNAALHSLGAKVRTFHPETTDMESAFIRLTEGKVS